VSGFFPAGFKTVITPRRFRGNRPTGGTADGSAVQRLNEGTEVLEHTEGMKPATRMLIFRVMRRQRLPPHLRRKTTMICLGIQRGRALKDVDVPAAVGLVARELPKGGFAS